MDYYNLWPSTPAQQNRIKRHAPLAHIRNPFLIKGSSNVRRAYICIFSSAPIPLWFPCGYMHLRIPHYLLYAKYESYKVVIGRNQKSLQQVKKVGFWYIITWCLTGVKVGRGTHGFWNYLI